MLLVYQDVVVVVVFVLLLVMVLVYHLTLARGRCSHHAEKRVSQLAHQRWHSVCHRIDGHVLLPGRLLSRGYAIQFPRTSIGLVNRSPAPAQRLLSQNKGDSASCRDRCC